MPRFHSPYPPEFRQQLVNLVRAGRTPEELAKEYEPTAESIRNWIKQADRDEGHRHDGLTSDEREELSRLRREQAMHPVRTMCRLLKVSTSGFYAWCARGPSDRYQSDLALKVEIRAIHERLRGTYGMPRVHAELAEDGHRIGRKRVARLMHEEGTRRQSTALCGNDPAPAQREAGA